MKLKSILICLFIACGLALQAQTISVKSFQALPMDMTASSLNGKRIDQNGQVAALIKVVTSQTGFTFEGGTLGIVDTQQRNGEIWVWVPRASRKITILHQQLGVLRDYRYPIEIESERTYEMVLTTGKVETIVKPEITQQYLAFQISPANAVLEVEGELWEVASDGPAMKFVNFGTYNYRVQAPNYHIEVGKVTVNDPEKTQKVTVTLKPDFVEVTLKVDADAEIWVNNEKKGTRTWTGNLGKGNYKIECKQASHETSMITKEITADLNGETINLPKPTPIYGSLNIESTPNFATIYIDGEMVGETPKFVSEILVGEHNLKLTKEGYADHAERITIQKGERKQVQTHMNEKTGIAQPIVETSSEDLFDQTFTVNGVSFTMKPVEGGTFLMGNDYDSPNSKPQHSMTVNTFYIGETEVTQALWKAVMGKTLKQHVKDDKDANLFNNPIGRNYPMYYVSWNDCQEFVRKLSELTGKNFRLPTEAEWEYAARGGKKSKKYKYAGSYKIDDVAWYKENSPVATWVGHFPRMHKVKKKLPNELGIFDMSGNVEEWCSDKYADYNTDAETQIFNFGVIRGGVYFFDADLCEVWDRSSENKKNRKNWLGFRIALSK